MLNGAPFRLRGGSTVPLGLKFLFYCSRLELGPRKGNINVLLVTIFLLNLQKFGKCESGQMRKTERNTTSEYF